MFLWVAERHACELWCSQKQRNSETKKSWSSHVELMGTPTQLASLSEEVKNISVFVTLVASCLLSPSCARTHTHPPHTHTHTHMHAHTCTHTHARTHACTHMHTHTHTYLGKRRGGWANRAAHSTSFSPKSLQTQNVCVCVCVCKLLKWLVCLLCNFYIFNNCFLSFKMYNMCYCVLWCG